jgi:predicted transcriptional regulator
MEGNCVTSISITIKEQTVTRLEELADAMDRSRSWIANEAIEQYLAHQDWMDRETIAAIAAVDAGDEKLIPHADIMAELEQRQKARRT